MFISGPRAHRTTFHMVHQRIEAVLFIFIITCVSPLAMASSYTGATPTEFSITQMYTDVVTMNATVNATQIGVCVYENVTTNEGDILIHQCDVFCTPGEFLCLNGSFFPIRACHCPAHNALAYITLVETCGSLLGCFVALLIYCFFCRNLIKMERDASRTHWVHLNLVISFLLRDIVIVATLTSDIDKICWKNIPMFIPTYSYIMECNFFWMFVEGLYLFVCVSFPYFRIESSPYLCTKVALFAWGVPCVLVSIWTVVGVQAMKRSSAAIANATNVNIVESETQVCTIDEEAFDTELLPAYICMHMWTVILLVFNLLMLIKILLTLREKLQGVPNSREQDSKHRRLAKATLFLVVLLGVPNLFPFLTNRLEDLLGGVAIFIINFIFVNMNSIQGLMVAILYVLCNSEVKRQVNRKCQMYECCSCWRYRRDSRRRSTRFGSSANEITRKTVVTNSTSASSKGSAVSVGNSAGSMYSETDTGQYNPHLEQKKQLLVNGEKRSNGNRHNSNESHSMITIDETEQECLLPGSQKGQHISIGTGNSPVTATYKKLTENPETAL